MPHRWRRVARGKIRGEPAVRSVQWEALSLLGPRASAEDPPLGLIDRHVVDAGLPPPHLPGVGERPQFVAIAAVPLTRGGAALVLEADTDPAAVECPQVLSQPIVQFAAPLTAQEPDDLSPASDELIPVSPDRVLRVGAGDPFRVPAIPGILGGLHFLAGRFLIERRQWRSLGHDSLPGGKRSLSTVHSIAGNHRFQRTVGASFADARAEQPYTRAVDCDWQEASGRAYRRVGVRLSRALCAVWQSRSPSPAGGGPTVCLCIGALWATILVRKQ